MSNSSTPEDKTQLLEGLYKSREILIAKVKEVSKQIRQLDVGALLFLLIFASLIYDEEFKPSKWKEAKKQFNDWIKDHYSSTETKSSVNKDKVSYFEFRDSSTYDDRKRILNFYDTVRQPSTFKFHYNKIQVEGISFDLRKHISRHNDGLRYLSKAFKKIQKEIEFYSDNNDVDLDLTDNWIQTYNEIDTLKKNYSNNKISSPPADSTLLSLFNKYDTLTQVLPITTVGLNLKKARDIINKITEPLDSIIYIIDEKITAFDEDSIIKSWKRIPLNQLTWSKKTWEFLSDISNIQRWNKVTRSNLTYTEQKEIRQKIFKDSSLVQIIEELQSYISGKIQSEKNTSPKSKVFDTDIRLPINEILLFLPLMIMTLTLVLQVLNLRRKTSEINLVRVEQQIQKINKNKFVITNIFGEELLRSSSNIKYFFTLKYTKLYENNPEKYHNIFFTFANVIIFSILMYQKWVSLINNYKFFTKESKEGNEYLWYILLHILVFSTFIIIYAVNLRTSRRVLAKARGYDHLIIKMLTRQKLNEEEIKQIKGASLHNNFNNRLENFFIEIFFGKGYNEKRESFIQNVLSQRKVESKDIAKYLSLRFGIPISGFTQNEINQIQFYLNSIITKALHQKHLSNQEIYDISGITLERIEHISLKTIDANELEGKDAIIYKLLRQEANDDDIQELTGFMVGNIEKLKKNKPQDNQSQG